MIVRAKVLKRSRQDKSDPSWQARFQEMAPRIERHAKVAFRHLRAEARAEAVQEVLCNVCCALARLAELNKLDLAYATPLAGFAVSQVKVGRKVGCSLNASDLLSPYCQRKRNITVKRLDHFDEEDGQWHEVLLETRHAGPADIACVRLDFAAWLRLLTRRYRRIAKVLAIGETTNAVAKRFSVSAGRISQIRKELKKAWERFQGENLETAPALATA